MTITERILITVRTYPTISAKYVETVCTGGINEEGEWRRLYPVPLRYLNNEQQYRTYDIIKVRLSDKSDGRKETRRPDSASIVVQEHLEQWASRRQWVDPTVCDSLEEFQAAERTIGPVRVREVLDFTAEAVDAEWSAIVKEKLKQENLFEELKSLEKIPFNFRFRWLDGAGKEHHSLFQAWEVGETWRQYKQRYPDPVQVMREKWLNEICGPGRDLSFFVGNIAKRRNVFMVCGIYNPPSTTRAAGQTLWTSS